MSLENILEKILKINEMIELTSYNFSEFFKNKPLLGILKIYILIRKIVWKNL